MSEQMRVLLAPLKCERRHLCSAIIRCFGASLVLITNATDKSVNNEIVRNKMLLCFGTARVLSRAISYVLSNRAEKPVCAPGPCYTLEIAMWAKQIYVLAIGR